MPLALAALDSGAEWGYNAGMDGSCTSGRTWSNWRILLGTLALLLAVSAGCRPPPPPPPSPATSTPEPPPTPKAGPATLRVDVKPHGAVVVIDGEERAQSPVTLTLAPAAHSVRVEQAGFTPLEETLALEPGGEAMVSGMLTDVEPPRLSVGELRLPVAPGQAVELNVNADDNLGVTLLQLWLGDELLGQASTGNLRAAWIPDEPGNYQLVARASDAAGNTADELVRLTVAVRPTATPTPLLAPTATAAPPAISPTPTLTASAEITASTLSVRDGPGTEFRLIGKVRLGQRVTVLARNPQSTWLQVCCVDGRQGWLSAAYVQVDQPPEAIPTAAVIRTPSAGQSVVSLPAPVTVEESTISILTYPFAPYVREAVDPEHGGFPVNVLDRAAYEASEPRPEPQTYRRLVLENEFLQVTLLPELGGRIYECIFKPTGNNEFYRNPVIKPTHWGPATLDGANWWLAAGGLEWGLPVEEHGYEWGTPWAYRIVRGDDGSATVHLWDSDDIRLRARVAVELPPDRAAFGLAISLENPTDRPVRYQFWNNAMLAPGASNQPSEALQFVFTTSEMTVHSTGDARLPGAGAAFSWPVYQGWDVSRLGTWREYLGFFERPAAQGDFVGVYDGIADEGIVRVYPSGIARGAKGFAFGWGDAAIPSENWTDDGSGYVELHGGVTPTFDEWAELGSGQTLEWRESWFPVSGISTILHAEPGGAVNVQRQTGGLRVSLFTTRRLTGRLVVTLEGKPITDVEVSVSPDRPMTRDVVLPSDAPERGRIGVSLIDGPGGILYVAMPPREMDLR